MPALKRPAAAAAVASSKVAKVSQKKEAAPPSKLESVLRALQQCGELPTECRGLLCAVLPSCAVPERHAVQDTMLAMIDEALQARESLLRGNSDAAEAAALSASSQFEAQQQAVVATKAAVEDSAKACSSQMMALGQAKEATDAAKAADVAAADALAGHARQVEALTKKKSDLKELVEARVAELKVAAIAESDTQKWLASLAEFKFDTGMLASLPCILSNAPEARGHFDEVVLDQFTASIEEQHAKINAELASGEVERQRLEGEKASAAEAAAAALAKQQALLENVEAAKEASRKAIEAHSEATKACTEGGAAATLAIAEADAKKKLLADFQVGPLTAFKELRDGPKVPEEKAAEPEEIAEESAAQATAEDKEEAAAVETAVAASA